MPNKIVGIIAEHDLTDSALTQFVRGLGYQAVVLDLDQPQPPVVEPARVVVVRSSTRLEQVATDARCFGAAVVLVEATESSTGSHRGVTVVSASERAADELVAVLEKVLGVGGRPGAVSLSPREREVLTTYVMGATVEETADKHFVATSTVRTHYRRVTERYNLAGRPVTNKTQLLLQMVADGWIRLPDSGPESGEGSDSGVA